MSKLKVLYDGACHLCFREVMHYKSKDCNDSLELVDISSDLFRASEYGLKDEDVNLHMHSIAEDGSVFVGVSSFVEIWKRIPPYDKLIPIFENQRLRPAIDKVYDVFARYIRPQLPKRKCQEGHCEISN